MGDTTNTVRVNVTITIDGETLQAIVRTAKDLVGRNEKGYYRIDTADLLDDLLSKFIAAKDFDAFAADPENYRFLDSK